MKSRFMEELGINISSVLLPDHGTNMKKWSVIACDQYTSEPEYWVKVKEFIGKEPSTLHLIFPEVFLDRETDTEKQKRITDINNTMCDYLENGYFTEIKNSMIYVERTIYGRKPSSPISKTRKGLVFAIDLEKYDFSKDSQSLIRATEGTILDRLPPRIKIREKACLELPHIMLLIDDPDHTVIEPLHRYKQQMNQLYCFDLMMDGGRVAGYQVDDTKFLEGIFESLLRLKSPSTVSRKYSVNSMYSPLLFAVGDGNHSLATAKACWERMKPSLSDEERETHPSRYALVELVNVHDPALEFEPIHRVVFNADPSDLFSSFQKFYIDQGVKCGYEYVSDKKDIPAYHIGHIIPFFHGTKTGFLWAVNSPFTLDTGTLQYFLDYYMNEKHNVEIDYIHGDDVTEKLGRTENNIGFLLSPMKKGDLFKTVILEGVLPRKSFSMGEAWEKRFYLECRSIR